MIEEKEYSIVIPVYYNETTLEFTEDSIRKNVLEKTPWRGEIVFVDDGSGDGSYEVLKRIHAKHPDDIRVFKLSRNFGQTNAVWCGMQHSSGAIVSISADGQDPADLIPNMLAKYFDEGCEVVLARRQGRDESWWRKITSALVYWCIKKLGHRDMPVGGFDFYVLGKKAKGKLLKVWQPHTFFQVRLLELGFSRAWLSYKREARKGGVSKWTFAKKFTYMIDGVLGHSYIPIRAMSVMGVICAGLSFLLGLYFFVAYLIQGGHAIKGWTPIVLLVLFLGGMQMLMIGVIGEYLWRVLAQVRNNPPYIIEERLES